MKASFFEEGAQARKTGVDARSNPYADRSVAYVEWLAGWKYAFMK